MFSHNTAPDNYAAILAALTPPFWSGFTNGILVALHGCNTYNDFVLTVLMYMYIARACVLLQSPSSHMCAPVMHQLAGIQLVLECARHYYIELKLSQNVMQRYDMYINLFSTNTEYEVLLKGLGQN